MLQGKLSLAGVTRVSLPQDRVAVTRHHLAWLEQAPHKLLHLVVGGVEADRLHHLVEEDEDLLVGEAVERAGQAAHAGRKGEVGVGQSWANQVGGVGGHVAPLVVAAQRRDLKVRVMANKRTQYGKD